MCEQDLRTHAGFKHLDARYEWTAPGRLGRYAHAKVPICDVVCVRADKRDEKARTPRTWPGHSGRLNGMLRGL